MQYRNTNKFCKKEKQGRQYLNDIPEKFNKTGDEEITSSLYLAEPAEENEA